MKLPEGWQFLFSRNGSILAYRMKYLEGSKGTIIDFTIEPRLCGFAMGCVKDDDSTITWDAGAMERDTR